MKPITRAPTAVYFYTGTAKREKMAVMEAAISSSLAHPNVVATYTYSIKPVRDTTRAQEKVSLKCDITLGRDTNTMSAMFTISNTLAVIVS